MRESVVRNNLERIIKTLNEEQKNILFQGADDNGKVFLTVSDLQNSLNIMDSYFGTMLPAMPEDTEARRTLGNILAAARKTMREVMAECEDKDEKARFETLVTWMVEATRAAQTGLPELSEVEQMIQRPFVLTTPLESDVINEEDSILVEFNTKTGEGRIKEADKKNDDKQKKNDKILT